MSVWYNYKNYVHRVVLIDLNDRPSEVSYWRSAVFCNILTYLTPLSLIALVPSVIMSFMTDVVVIGVADIIAFIAILLITFCPGIRIEIRKASFIILLFCLSVILLYYLPLPAPGLLFALAVTILTSLIYSSAASYVSSWANAVVCIVFALIIYLEVESPIASTYTVGSWIAISSNLILLSFAFSKCMQLLLDGLTKSLEENKIAEVKLEKANRLYQFISEINQTIVHVSDEKTLFSRSCEIALEIGKYQAAWIGRFDLPQQKLVLLNSCGLTEQEVDSFINSPNHSDGPEDYVLRTGQYFLCNNIEQDHELKTWKRYAKKHGIRSFIVLPIKKSGSIYGTYNLYSNEFNAFDKDDIALLQEVSGDISFALDIMENVKRRREAEIEIQRSFVELEAVFSQQAAILNTLPASIALLDGDGKILKVNDEWMHFGQLNGQDASYDPIGKDYIGISQKSFGVEAEDGLQMAQGLKEILTGTKEHFTIEYACDTSMEKRWYRADVRPFKTPVLKGAVVMHFDISERKKSENEMLLLINNTEESFVLLNHELQIVSFNNQFKNLYSNYFGVEVRKGNSILDYAQPARRGIVAAIYKKVLEGSVEESQIELPGPNRTMHYFSLKFSPARDESGRIFGAFVTALDITEKRKAIEQNEYERRNKEALINSTNDLIWSVSMDSKLIAANNAFLHSMKELTGVEPKPGDDFSRTERIGSDTFNVWSTLYATAFTGKSFKPEVYTPPTTEHAESWIEASFSPIVVNDVMVGIACFSRDITQRKLAELERAKMTDDLIQRNRDLEQFTFIISHNLRAPSANIIGLTQFLQSGTLSAEEQIRCLDGLATSAANLDAVIKDINTILQVKREIKEKKEFISFSTLVNDILVSLGNVYDKKRIHLTTDFAEVDEIFSLKAYLHSVFYNLISNSIKYSKPHEQASIEIKSKKEKGNVILTFKDNGLGIDLNTKGDKVFGLYRRFHSHVEGKGMGLFMVKTQVEAIGGKISVASEVNNGTEFTITLQNLIDNSNDYDTKTIYPRG